MMRNHMNEEQTNIEHKMLSQWSETKQAID